MQQELETLNLIRLENGWSYQRLGDEIGMSKMTLHQILAGTCAPRDTTLHRLRKYLAQPATRKMLKGFGK